MSSQRDTPAAGAVPEDRAAELARLAREVVSSAGAELVGVELAGAARRPVARVFVHVPGGTTADACARLSRALQARLDAGTVLGERYTLEVSSPGLDRPLRTRRDFERLRGRDVALRLAPEPRGERRPRELIGVLEDVGGEAGETGFWIRVRPARRGEPVRLSAAEIESARAHMPW